MVPPRGPSSVAFVGATVTEYPVGLLVRTVRPTAASFSTEAPGTPPNVKLVLLRVSVMPDPTSTLMVTGSGGVVAARAGLLGATTSDAMARTETAARWRRLRELRMGFTAF